MKFEIQSQMTFRKVFYYTHKYLIDLINIKINLNESMKKLEKLMGTTIIKRKLNSNIPLIRSKT